jgi:hypothetical protein
MRKLVFLAAGIGTALGLAISAQAAEKSLFERLGPVPKASGFHMDGYYVWCGSAIKVGDTYHLFASRWPVATVFPNGYRQHCEIVRATAARPEGPYAFQEVVIGRREPGKWDSAMGHNPAIYQVGNTFVLYYIGSDIGKHYRQIGIATAPAVTGPWTRSDTPLDLGFKCDANNPAACFERDGSVKLLWRDGYQRVFISTAPNFRGPYTVTNDNVWPAGKLEDFFFYKQGGQYHILCEDNAHQITGHPRWGADICSPNGVTKWTASASASAYDHTIRWTDGGTFEAVRRERPWLLIENGKATALFTSVWDDKASWNQPVPIIPAMAVDP